MHHKDEDIKELYWGITRTACTKCESHDAMHIDLYWHCEVQSWRLGRALGCLVKGCKVGGLEEMCHE